MGCISNGSSFFLFFITFILSSSLYDIKMLLTAMHSFRWTRWTYICVGVCVCVYIVPTWSVFAYKNSTDEPVQHQEKTVHPNWEIKMKRAEEWKNGKKRCRSSKDFNCKSRGCWILTRFSSDATQLISFWLPWEKKSSLIWLRFVKVHNAIAKIKNKTVFVFWYRWTCDAFGGTEIEKSRKMKLWWNATEVD